MRKKHLYYENSMGTNFQGFPHSIDFVAFFYAMGNWWENTCIFHMIKYTIRWSNGEKASILWEKYEYQFPSFSLCNGFCCIFPCHGKLMAKPMYFPYAEVYRRVEIEWEKSIHDIGKVWVPIFQILPYSGFCCIFLYYGKLFAKTMHFPIHYFFQCVGKMFNCNHHGIEKKFPLWWFWE